MLTLWARIVLASGCSLVAVLLGSAVSAVQDQCGPFTDVGSAYCPYVLEMYYLGLTAGTSPTTFSPDSPVTRGQAAVFVSKGVNQAIARSTRRAALGQWWTTTPHYESGLGVTTVGTNPEFVGCDGADVWTANYGDATVSRVRGSDGSVLGTWTGAVSGSGVLVAMGRIFVIGRTTPGRLFSIDPTQPPGAVQLVTDSLWGEPVGIAFDGNNIWIASAGGLKDPGGALSIVSPAATYPWSSTTIKQDVLVPSGIAYDGLSIWFVDKGNQSLKRVDDAGAVVQQVPLGPHSPEGLLFDGSNFWLAGQDGHLLVVSPASGAVVADLTGNGLGVSFAAAFDGERVLVPTRDSSNIEQRLSLWRAADLAPLGSHIVSGQGNSPYGACSDGVNFWVALQNSPGQLGRF